MRGSSLPSLGPAHVASSPARGRAHRLSLVRGGDAAVAHEAQPVVSRAADRRGHLAIERAPDGGVVFVGHASDGRTPVRAAVDLAHDDWLDVASRLAELLDVYESRPAIVLARR